MPEVWPCTHQVEDCLCVNSAERLLMLRTPNLDNQYLREYVVELSEGPLTMHTADQVAARLEAALLSGDSGLIIQAWLHAEAAGLASWREGDWQWHQR
jgi:hypothetical protein